jgi:hypothetical protein
LKAQHLFVVLALSVGLLCAGEFILPVAVAMGGQLEYAQESQREKASEEKTVTPSMGACDRIPSRYQGHDELPHTLFFGGVCFLIGFKIAAWMSKRQIERLKRIWDK